MNKIIKLEFPERWKGGGGGGVPFKSCLRGDQYFGWNFKCSYDNGELFETLTND